MANDMPKPPSERIHWNTSWIIFGFMRGIPFQFFARVILMTASFVLALLSLTTRVTGKEFVFAGGSVAAVMLASLLRRKRRHNRSRNHHPRPLPDSD
ncbi:MAG TPA: hypothetical protein VFH95_12660 [Candidatus Kapabacteria bacterium]|nr:hypothetical protein [Candidatus Kapabacteria bacterium]